MGYQCIVDYDYMWYQVRNSNNYITSLMTILSINVIVIKDERKKERNYFVMNTVSCKFYYSYENYQTVAHYAHGLNLMYSYKVRKKRNIV